MSLALRRSLSLALRQSFFEFASSHTTHRPPHYHALGRRAVVKAVWEVDRQLAAVSNQFDYLLQLTPVNTNGAWKQFERERFERVPEFHYRPLPVDPAALKRELYRISIERIEDPALQRLFQEKQEELELKLTMLRDRDTPSWLTETIPDDMLDRMRLRENLLEQTGGPLKRFALKRLIGDRDARGIIRLLRERYQAKDVLVQQQNVARAEALAFIAR